MLFNNSSHNKHNICIHGGLGNQMFTYAFYKYMKKKSVLDVEPSFWGFLLNFHAVSTGQSLSYIDDILNTETINDRFNASSRILNIIKHIQFRAVKVFGKIHYERTPYCFDNALHTIATPKIFYGYFQSHHYVDAVRDELLQEFTLQKPLSDYSQNILKTIGDTPCPVAIHIRRGDYADIGFGMLDVDYFKTAWDIITKKYPNAQPFVFSMDTEWCRENLDFLPNPIFCYNSDVPQAEDMFLMAKCQHNIIANSSYSWWAAYLNKNPNKMVVAPKNWGNLLKGREDNNNLLPPSWVKI